MSYLTIKATILLFLVKALLVQFMIGGAPVANGQSLTPNCWTCPVAGLLSSEEGLGTVVCTYNSDVCVFETGAGLLIEGGNGCASSAVNDCPLRRAIKREHALPRSPRPPSPGAFATKPKVMRTRAALQKGKRVTRDL